MGGGTIARSYELALGGIWTLPPRKKLIDFCEDVLSESIFREPYYQFMKLHCPFPVGLLLDGSDSVWGLFLSC
jgi:hypothetical protein